METTLIAPGAQHHSALLIVFAPVVGGLLIGVMARFGSEKIRGHGMPEAIEAILTGGSRVQPRVALLKPISAAISIGTGGPFGAEGPIFMIGGALGALESHLFPHVAPGFWSLVGLAAVVGGVMRSPFTGVVFSLELTHEWGALLPLVIAASAAYGLSVLLLKRSVLTEKIARRDMHLTREYSIDPLEVLFVRDVMCTDIIYFRADTPVVEAAAGFVSGLRPARGEQHRQRLYPVLDAERHLVGVVTRRDMLAAALDRGDVDASATLAEVALQQPIVTYPDITLREAANFIADQGVTRLPVVHRDQPHQLLGMVTLVDLLAGRLVDLQEERDAARVFRLRPLIPRDRVTARAARTG